MMRLPAPGVARAPSIANVSDIAESSVLAWFPDNSSKASSMSLQQVCEAEHSSAFSLTHALAVRTLQLLQEEGLSLLYPWTCRVRAGFIVH